MWDDLDLDEGVAYISRQRQQGVGGQLRACPLEAESSLRAVALDPETVIVLRASRRVLPCRAACQEASSRRAARLRAAFSAAA
jgi:hypothetical protein